MAANMQSMCQYWKNFDLQELQRELDTTATELANRQDESEGSRKRLVEQSRDFKKNTPEDIRKVVAPLLKSFQVEIDSLSKRSKAAEAAFLSVYKKLIDLPDPVPVLEHAQNLQKKAHKVQDLEIENKQLRETLEEYNHEFAEVKNQEVTIKQLKEKLREHEERVEATAQTRAKEKERELQRTFAEKERQLQETQLSVAKKLGEAEQQITSLHSALETAQSELFEIKAKYDEATSAKSDEMEMVMADLDRANERAANAERQAERLKQQLAQVESFSQHAELVRSQHSSDTDQAMDSFKRSSQEVELAAKEKEIAQLVEDVQRLQASLNKLRESTSAQVARLEEELTTKNLAFRALEEKLRTQEDYEEVKRELRVLKSIEFANAYSSDGVPEENKSLEVLLLEKNKSLQTENTHLKVVNSGLTDNTTTLHLPTTTTSTTKKYERSSSMMSSSSSSQSSLLPTTTSAAASPPTNLTLAVSPTNLSRSSHIGPSDMTLGRSAMSGMSLHGSCTPPVVSAATIKQEAPSPASSTPRATPQHAASTPEAYASMSGADSVMNMYRMPSTPSSGRHSPTTNCKLSPDIPTPSQTPHTNSIPPQSPIALHSHIDPRHFAPPMSPFYGFPGSPFHPAFLPLNMVKSEVNTSSGGLDTGYVAKTVRELLSIHNIGQRLFAKHVLGLSQGTVSELLSKPKSWDKLTEKGRESYRKMHAWATDEANIMALKAISPKKGTQPLTPNNSYKEKEDSVTEERIANILNEAQVAMHMKKSLEQAALQQQVANAVVSSIYHHELSKMGGAPPGLTMMSPTMPPSSLSNGPHYPREGSRKIRDHDSRHHSSSSSQDEAASAQEMVARIYRQELEKLKSAADAAGNIAASAMYAQELSRLNTPQNISSSSSRHHHCSPPTPPGRESPEPSPLALDCRSTRPNGLNLKTEPPDSTSEETASQVNNYGAIDLSKPSSQSGSTPGSSPSSETGRHAGSAFFLVRPRVNGHDSDSSPLTPTQQQQGSAGGPRYGSVPPAECLSPLQRMQNIANSLTSRPNAGMPNAKPLRAVLPPITQEEFDRYANMNTDELVKKVKETLSQYSISQRLFGESVLGLSQGSVSDLLARPKPWHMLTQKGREPFIRMQIFLEDADSIPKLVASQYRIPPDKLMRSSSRGSNEPESPCDLPAPSRSQGSSLPSQQQQAPPPPLLASQPPPLSLAFSHPSQCSIASPSSPPSSQSPPLLSTPRHYPPPPPPPPPPHPHSLPHSPILPSPTTPTSAVGRLGPLPLLPPTLPPGIGPAGLPHEHLLSADSAMLQRVWGTFAYPPSMLEVIAMASEIDTLSLTSKVKDVLQFHNLGQKLFGEAVLGLSQGSVSELLSKPKPWHMLSIKGREPFIKMHLWLGDPQNVEHLKLYQTHMKAHRRRKSSMEDRSFDSPTQPKRPRVFFTEDQKDSLRSAYAQDPYPNQSTIESLAKNLNVGVKTVINWFHNHRMRAKQQHHPGSESNIKSEPDESSNQSDISSMSGEVSSALPGSQFFHGGVTPTDLNQWMFPQFEPMTLMNKVPLNDDGEDNKENHGGLEDDDDEMDEPDGLDTVPSNNNNNLKEKDGPDGENEGEEWRRERSVDAAKQPSSESTAVSSSTSGSNGGASVNKRKRSNPQRVYEGAQLDRTFGASSSETIHEAAELSAHQDETGRKSGASLHSEMNGNGEQAVDHGLSSAGACSSSSKPVYRIEKIEKMENCIKSSVEHWDDEDGEPMSSIEKIQKHLDNNSADEDWEIL